MPLLSNPPVFWAARILIFLVFAQAVVGKAQNRAEFMGVVANYRLVPQWAAPCVAWGVLGAELLLLGLLAWPATVASGAALAGVLLLIFATAMAINLARGRRDIDCGCFQSDLRQHLSRVLVLRNFLLAAVCALLLLPKPGAATALEVIDGLGAGLSLFLLYLATGQIVALHEMADAFRKRFA